MSISKSIILLLFLAVSSLPLFAQIPNSIMRARNNAPEDYIVGIGVGKAQTDWESMSLAETRARAQIASAIYSEVGRTIKDYTVESELTGETIRFSEEVTVVLLTVHVRNSWIAELVKESDGTWWCVVYFNRADTEREISQAQAAAKLAVPAFLLQRAEDRMDEASERAVMEDWYNNAIDEKED